MQVTKAKKQISIFLIITILVSSIFGKNNIIYAANSHIHTSDCYVGHNHAASDCTLIPAHHHTGDSVHGGGCYGEPVYHKHTESCVCFGDGSKHNEYKITIFKEGDGYYSDSGLWGGRSGGLIIHCPSTDDTVLNISYSLRPESSNNVFSSSYTSTSVYLYKKGGAYLFRESSRQYAAYSSYTSTGDSELYSKCKAFCSDLLNSVYTKPTEISQDNQYRKTGFIKATDVQSLVHKYDLLRGKVPLACFRCNDSQKVPIYSCGKTEQTIEKYQLSCGKAECEEHWSCGIQEEQSFIHNHSDKNGVHHDDNYIASESGGCYTSPHKHVHTDKCYKTVNGIVREITGVLIEHNSYNYIDDEVAPYKKLIIEATNWYYSCFSDFTFSSYYSKKNVEFNRPCISARIGHYFDKDGSSNQWGSAGVAWKSIPTIDIHNGINNATYTIDARIPEKLYSEFQGLGFLRYPTDAFLPCLGIHYNSNYGLNRWEDIGSEKAVTSDQVESVMQKIRPYLAQWGWYVIPGTTSFVDINVTPKAPNLSQYRVLVCDKQEGDIDGYTISCNKYDGKYYTESGKEVSPICDKIITSIEPKERRIKTYFGEEPRNIKAIATYLDGHVEEIEADCKGSSAKVDVDEHYNLTYKGRIHNASYGVGSISCPVTVWTAPLTGITINNKNQVVYEGDSVSTLLTAHYKDMPDKTITATSNITSSLNSSKLGEQEVTVTYREGNLSKTDTLQARVVPKPSSLSVEDAAVDKGNVPSYAVTVHYTDGSKDNYTVQGDSLNTQKTYSVNGVSIHVPVSFMISLENKNEAESGKDSTTGGTYKASITYKENNITTNGVSELKVFDTCTQNRKHAKFPHDACPVCKYLKENKGELENYKNANEALQKELEDTLASLNTNKTFSDSDFSSRYQQQVSDNLGVYTDSVSKLKSLLQSLKDSHDKFDTDFNTAEDIEIADKVMSDMKQELDNRREEYNTNKQDANGSYNVLAELADKTDKMSQTIPEILIQNENYDKATGKITYDYQKKEFKLDVIAIGCDFDKDEVETELSIYDGAEFRPLEKGDLISAGKYQLKIKTISDDYKENSLLIELNVLPKKVNYTAKPVTKVYDGTTQCKITYSDVLNKVGEDEVGITNPQGNFQDKNVGSDIEVSLLSNIELTGKDAKNYIIEQPILKGKIIPKKLQVTTKPISMEYGEAIPEEVTFLYDGFIPRESENNVHVKYPQIKMPVVYEAKEYPVVVTGGAICPNYNLTYKDGVLTVTAPKNSKKVEIVTVVSEGAITVHANRNGKKQKLILNSKNNRMNVYHQPGSCEEFSFLVDGKKYSYQVTDEGVFPILDIAYGDIVISGNKKVIITQGEISCEVPYDTIVITGKTKSNTVKTDEFKGTIILRDLEIELKGKNPIDITNNSKVQIDLVENSTLSTSENYAGIRVDASSSITISGDGSLSIPNSGIGGNTEESCGAITINGGTIDCKYIGTGKNYTGTSNGNIAINGGIVNVNEIRPQATSNSKIVKVVQVPVPKSLLDKEIFYQRGESFFGTKVCDNNTITILVYETDKKVEALVDGKKYYITVTDHKGTLHSYYSGSSENSNSMNKETNKKQEEQKKIRNTLKLAQSVVTEGANTIHYNNSDKVYYINQKELKAKNGYVLSKDGRTWKRKISSGKQKVYRDYDWYSYNKDKKEMKAIVLSKTIVDYEKPVIKFKKTKLTEEISKPSINYGVSGRKTSYYKLVEKGKNAAEVPWKLLAKRTTIRKKRGIYTLYVKATDKAANCNIQKKVLRMGEKL